MLQEVFVAAHTAMLADERPINARPWLYRIARNRCLNHLRKPTADGVRTRWTSIRTRTATTTLEQVQQREELREIVSDMQRASRDAADRAGPARDRRSHLQRDRPGDGHHAARP